MKNKLLLYLMLSCVAFSYAQNEETPLDPLLETNPMSNDQMDIILHNIQLDDISIPLTLSYNNTGIKANEMPGSLGVSWKLKDIGKISHIVNQLPDELQLTQTQIDNIQDIPGVQTQIPNVNGWFFSKDADPIPYVLSQEYMGFRKKYVDTAPDYFILNTQTGLNSLFVYKKNFGPNNTLLDPLPVFMSSNQKCTINTYFNNLNYNISNYSDIVFEIKDENGSQYNFIGGPIQETISRSGSDINNRYKDYYLKSINSTFNTDTVTIDYIENMCDVYMFMANGSYHPEDNTTHSLLQDYGFQTNNTLDIKEIITPREIIKFNYISVHVGGSDYGNEDVNQLTEINIYNTNGEFVTGYFFEYAYFTDNRFVLSKILKYNKSRTDYVMFREFQYYPGSPNSRTSFNQDMFGYSNNPVTPNETLLPFKTGICPPPPYTTITSYFQAGDRTPNLAAMLKGMLKTITTNVGGVTEYSYQLKADNQYYGGGLVLSKIIETPNLGTPKTTNYSYESLKGFVLPFSGYKEYFYQFLQQRSYRLASNFPYRYYDTNPLDYEQEFLYYRVQKSGNYFSKIKTSTNYDFFDIQGEEGEVALVNVYDYIPSYEGIIRAPLLSKKTTYKAYNYQGTEVNSELINVEDRVYDRTSEYYVRAVESTEVTYPECHPGEGGPGGEIAVYIAPVYIIDQTLRQILTKDYSYSPVIETKKEITYIGDGSSIYDFDQLRPKEIITYKNNSPLTKKKFTYLFEMAIPSSGLDNSQYITPDHSLLFDESNWNYSTSSGKWILKEAEISQFYDDGKLRRLSKVHKNQTNNTPYNETTYQPEVFMGNQANVTEENIITLTYDANGKLSSIVNLENGDISVFSRSNDKDSYNVNTVVKGNKYAISQFNFYRNSFENSTINTLSTALAYTGNKVYTASTIQVGTFPSGHIISFWYYFNNKWEMKTSVHTGGIVTITKPIGAIYLDEIWVRPANTILTGFTYDPLIGRTSVIDDNGLVLKTIYDEYNREIKQADQDNNLLHKKEYNLIWD